MTAPLLDKLRPALPTISVGALSADLLDLGRDLAAVASAGVRLIHVDVMDGCFCPMLTAGPVLVKAIQGAMLKDVHLMVRDPLPKLEAFVAAGADLLTFAVEGADHPHRVLQTLGGMTNANDASRGLLRGVSLNPGTPLTVLEPLLDELDVVLLLAINPGWSGQQFLPQTRQRIAQTRRMLDEAGREAVIMVDGGVTRENIAEVTGMGADVIVTGSAVFRDGDPAAGAKAMLDAASAGRKGTRHA